jgi:hypothetical protein
VEPLLQKTFVFYPVADFCLALVGHLFLGRLNFSPTDRLSLSLSLQDVSQQDLSPDILLVFSLPGLKHM